MAVTRGSLPKAIVAAFPSPLDLQFRSGQELAGAVEKDPVKVTAEAEAISRLAAKLPAKAVLQRLLRAADGEGDKAPQLQRELKVGDRVVGTLQKDRRGSIAIKVKGGVLQPNQENKLLEFIDKLLQP